MSEAFNEYKKWLEWFIEEGGKPKLYKDIDFPKNTYIVARENGFYKGGYGSDLIRLIIPKNISDVTIVELGHSLIYTYKKEDYKMIYEELGDDPFKSGNVYQYRDLCLDFQAKSEAISRERLYLIEQGLDSIENYDNEEHLRLSNL